MGQTHSGLWPSLTPILLPPSPLARSFSGPWLSHLPPVCSSLSFLSPILAPHCLVHVLHFPRVPSLLSTITTSSASCLFGQPASWAADIFSVCTGAHWHTQISSWMHSPAAFMKWAVVILPREAMFSPERCRADWAGSNLEDWKNDGAANPRLREPYYKRIRFLLRA